MLLKQVRWIHFATDLAKLVGTGKNLHADLQADTSVDLIKKEQAEQIQKLQHQLGNGN